MNINPLNKWLLLSSFLVISLTSQNYLMASGFTDFSRRFYYGGYLGVELGLVNQFEISPVAGFRISPRWSAGTGAKYQYYHDRQLDQVFRAHLFAPLAFSDFVAIRDLDEFFPFRFIEGAFTIHVQMDMFSLPTAHFDLDNDHAGQSRFFRPTWLAGAGLRRQTGPYSYFNILIMMDISDHLRSVYKNPVVRFGLTF
jgi:hypothetical protein